MSYFIPEFPFFKQKKDGIFSTLEKIVFRKISENIDDLNFQKFKGNFEKLLKLNASWIYKILPNSINLCKFFSVYIENNGTPLHKWFIRSCSFFFNLDQIRVNTAPTMSKQCDWIIFLVFEFLHVRLFINQSKQIEILWNKSKLFQTLLAIFLKIDYPVFSDKQRLSQIKIFQDLRS